MNCGKELPDGTEKCPNCGKEISSHNSDITFSDVANYAGQQVNKAVTGVQTKVQASAEAYQKEQNDRQVNQLSDIIIDSQEQQISVIGSNYLDNMLRGGGLKKGFGILTDRRFYFKGKCYTRVAGQHKLVDEEYMIDLENITATGFVFSRRFLFLVLTILTIPTIVGALLFLIIYWLTKRVMYEVHFDGGMVCLDVSKYGGIKEVREFNKALRKAKDLRK